MRFPSEVNPLQRCRDGRKAIEVACCDGMGTEVVPRGEMLQLCSQRPGRIAESDPPERTLGFRSQVLEVMEAGWP